MSEISDSKPAKYPPSASPEVRAVRIFVYLLNELYVQADPKFLDKIPNHDGYVEVADKDQFPIGKMDIQIKALNEKSINPPRHQSDLKYLAHCRGNYTPNILVGVDIKNEIVYWVHMDDNLINSLEVKDKASSVTIKFPEVNKFFKNSDENYIDVWRAIVYEQRKKHSDYPDLKTNYENISTKYQELLDNFEPSIGQAKKEFENIHIFLDVLNHYLDKEFLCVKAVFYGACWKVGFAYDQYTDKHLHFVLYPVQIDRNDAQIKTIAEKLKKKLEQSGLTFHQRYPNIIHDNPKSAAIKVLDERFKTMIKYVGIPGFNKMLAIEEIFARLDRSKHGDMNAVDLTDLKKIEMHEPERFEDLIDYLEAMKITKIERLYKKPLGKNGPFVWSHWSIEDIRDNVEIAYKYMPVVYDELIQKCFPGLAEKEYFFKGFNFLLIGVFFNEKGTPLIDYYYLESKGDDKKRIEVYPLANLPVSAESLKIKNEVLIGDKSYIVKGWSKGLLRFIFEALPLYELIREKIVYDIGRYLEGLHNGKV